MIRVGIAGATGYTGIELVRLLSAHPHVVLKRLYSKSQVGAVFSTLFPQFSGRVDSVLDPLSADTLDDIDILFLALPHGQAQHHYELFRSLNLRVIDLSADFRLNNPSHYAKYYGEPHARPDLLGSIPLGLPEVYFNEIKNAQYVACPGCYATSVMLALKPATDAGWVTGPVIADAKSGVSGAGKSLKESSLYCEVNGAFSAYGTHGHRHRPEMEMVTGATILFSPHLVPMNRGILASVYIPVDPSLTQSKIFSHYQDYYTNAPFVSVFEGTNTPSTKFVSGTNHCWLTVKHCPDINQLVIFSAIDNLLKGASGQAIQCMNIMIGAPESAGLPVITPYL